VRSAGYRIVNVDSTVVAEEPRLHPHLHQMRDNIARSLKLEVAVVSVKATSPEGLGALGRKDGIAAQAVALIEQT
jgi:2-C-methyl-D-erythritol 2,4-cyclodiphosphate synthase